MNRKSILRAVSTTVAVAALGLGLAGTASAVTGEPRDTVGAVGQGCVNQGITLLGCVQVVDVLNDLNLDLDVLSDVVETVDVHVPVEDVTAQLPIVGSFAHDHLK